MLVKRLLPLLLALAAPIPGHTDAETEAEVRRLEATLGRIQQAQMSLYQQFQMTQELRRAELARPDPFAPQPSVGIALPPMDYNELQRLRDAREQRIKDLGAELDRLYARYQELEQLTAELQKLSHKANDNIERIGAVVERVEDISLTVARVVGAVGGLTRIGQYAGVAAGVKRGVEVFLTRLKDRRH